MRKLFEMTSDLLATISLDGCFTLLNPAWEQLLGWSREELQSRPVAEFVHPEDAEQLLGPMRAGDGHPAEVENFTTRYRHRDGSWRWLLWSARRDGETWYAAAKDVTDRVWLERQALHDPLTKLPNRTLLMDRARQAMSRLHRSPGVLAMLFVDLDKFKAVNDNLGHDVGDRLLVSVSERLVGADARQRHDRAPRRRRVRDPRRGTRERGRGDGACRARARRARGALPARHRRSRDARERRRRRSRTTHETDPEAMLREADLAMYKAKGAGGRRLELFDESLRRAMSTQVELESLLREALPRQELCLAYQPILPLTGGQAVGIEALVRWRPQRDERAPRSCWPRRSCRPPRTAS